MLLDQSLEAFHKLFSWTSVGPSKFPIDKMIGSQDHQNVWVVQWVQCDIIQSLLQTWFFRTEWISKPIMKKLILLSIKLACFYKLF